MSGHIDDGGPAFPCQLVIEGSAPGESAVVTSALGMSLRDWFAGMALQGMATHHGQICDGYRENLAKNSYRVADAMLAARNGKEAA